MLAFFLDELSKKCDSFRPFSFTSESKLWEFKHELLLLYAKFQYVVEEAVELERRSQKLNI